MQFDGTCPTCKFPGDECTLCMFVSTSVSLYTLVFLVLSLLCLFVLGARDFIVMLLRNHFQMLTLDVKRSDWEMWSFVPYGMLQLQLGRD